MSPKCSRRSMLKGTSVSLAMMGVPEALVKLSAAEIATRYDYKPKLQNAPMGVARGIYPGRVVWAHDPDAARWSGNVSSTTDQWWMDKNTSQHRVDAMLSGTLRSLTGSKNDEAAWEKMFSYYNEGMHGVRRGYRPGEIVAIKVNLNNSSAEGTGNVVNVSPRWHWQSLGSWFTTGWCDLPTS
jgi:hypothetical protein